MKKSNLFHTLMEDGTVGGPSSPLKKFYYLAKSYKFKLPLKLLSSSNKLKSNAGSSTNKTESKHIITSKSSNKNNIYFVQ